VTPAAVVIVCTLGWCALVVTFSPIIGARLAGRPITRRDWTDVMWAGLAMFLVLFCVAILIIGARS
jgi:hypothetical protein